MTHANPHTIMRSVLLIITGFFYMMPGLRGQVKDTITVSQAGDFDAAQYKPIAVYKGDMKELAKAVEKKYAAKQYPPAADSALIFRAFVDKHPLNALEKLELLEGRRSAFSDLISQSLRESGRSWRPMLQGGRSVKSYIWVIARLNGDGSITLSTGNDNDM
ncbi:hypothetical protein [Chitinophaga barathri]|uniref:Uncharacterized protein n=1 Tax=Chitinophaga barathri TaxID=1647451 RepID=A0A3N4MD03_9BACT|nr:hypothetical protein [Chitinophaga barathri]RPD41812.1 hypothetical protein EG028_06495 [Chitinophaga barathri]